MKPFSTVAEAMPRSGIREMMELAATLEKVIHLEVGEPSFSTPPHVIEAALADARAGYTRYTPTAGLPSLRSLIAEKASSERGRRVAPDQVLVATGAVGALAAALFGLLEEGDEVLLPDPGWPNYAMMAALARAQPRFYGLRPEDEYLPDPDQVAALVTPRTKALIVNTPANPTGAVFPAETVRALVRLAVERDLYLVTDEVYERLVFDGVHVPAALYDADRVITVSGCSKSYAMTGWRLGYLIGPSAFVSLLSKVQEPLVSCASSLAQRAAEAAMKGPQEVVEEMRCAYQRRRDLVYEALSPSGLLKSPPRGAFYALVDLRRLGMTSRDLARSLLLEERVATAPGHTFGPAAEGMVRISLAASDGELGEGCRRILSFAQRHADSDR